MNRTQTASEARTSPIARVCLAVLVSMSMLAFAACGTGAKSGGWDADASQTPANDRFQTCGSDADCPSRTGCHRASGLCVPFPEDAPTFALAIDPATVTPLIADQFTGVHLGADGILDLSVAAPVVLSGAVFHAASLGAWDDFQAAGTPESADRTHQASGRLVAIADGRIAGTQFRSESPTTFDPDSGEWRYSLSLLPGVPYEVTFIPTTDEGDAALPPYRFQATAAASQTRDLVLPPAEAYLHVDGVVLDGDAQVPIEGALVSCRVGDRHIGTSDTTKADGSFHVVLPPETGSVVIRARHGVASVRFPMREVAWDGGIDAFRTEYAASPLVVIDAAPIPALRSVAVQVLARVSDEEVAVPGARLSFDGTAGGGAASASSVTDDSGIVNVTLLEGVYALSIVPPVNAGFATRQVTLDLTANDHQAFRQYLDDRVVATGTVFRNADGLPVAGATVALLTDRSDTLDATYGGANDATFTATTDVDGRFTMHVDPGRYALVVDPPAGAPLARTVAPSIDLATGRDLGIPLPDARLVRGRIVGADDGQPLSGARVRLYHDLSGNAGAWWSLDGTTFAAELLRVADVTTDAEGRYEAVVPRLSTGEGADGEPVDVMEPGYGGRDASGGGGPGNEGGGFPLPPVEVD